MENNKTNNLIDDKTSEDERLNSLQERLQALVPKHRNSNPSQNNMKTTETKEIKTTKTTTEILDCDPNCYCLQVISLSEHFSICKICKGTLLPIEKLIEDKKTTEINLEKTRNKLASVFVQHVFY